MVASDNIIEVNETNFEYEVVSFSRNTPVLVNFWADWCHPCKILAPLLEKIVGEAGENLRLAKVDINKNPNLAMQYNVRSIPTVKAFLEGRVASEFVGVLPEARIREFISKLTPPSPLELDLEKGQNLLLSHDWQKAESILRNALQQRTDSPIAHLGLAKALLAQNQAKQALEHLDAIPSGWEFSQAEILRPYAEALLQLEKYTLPKDNDSDLVFINSMKLASHGKFAIALDGFLDILRKDKRYRGKIAQRVVLGILEIMGGEDPDTRNYRAELASALF